VALPLRYSSTPQRRANRTRNSSCGAASQVQFHPTEKSKQNKQQQLWRCHSGTALHQRKEQTEQETAAAAVDQLSGTVPLHREEQTGQYQQLFSCLLGTRHPTDRSNRTKYRICLTVSQVRFHPTGKTKELSYTIVPNKKEPKEKYGCGDNHLRLSFS
jgi:hypothetical protein